jgi:FKBP-type peptidyl-prolyl cis-trans isomerase FklB
VRRNSGWFSLFNKDEIVRFLKLAVIAAFTLMIPLEASATAPRRAKAKCVVRVLPNPILPAAKMNPETNLQAATQFMASNATRRGVTTTASGLQYTITRSGPVSGANPTAASIVEVNYEGKLLDGQVFDSSFARCQSAEFPVNLLIPAWVEALQLMRPGDEWTIYVPPSLGYGARGAAPVIPPNAALVFRMKLERIVR